MLSISTNQFSCNLIFDLGLICSLTVCVVSIVKATCCRVSRECPAHRRSPSPTWAVSPTSPTGGPRCSPTSWPMARSETSVPSCPRSPSARSARRLGSRCTMLSPPSSNWLPACNYTQRMEGGFRSPVLQIGTASSTRVRLGQCLGLDESVREGRRLLVIVKRD